MQVDVSSGRVTKRLEGIGRMVHGLVGWKGVLVVLDSQRGNLITVDPDTEDQTTIWQVSISASFFKIKQNVFWIL